MTSKADPAQSIVKTHPWSDDLLEQTIDVWQPYASYPLSREDAREILENLTGYFKVLQEWDRRERFCQPQDDVGQRLS